jgi:hypothetical protein
VGQDGILRPIGNRPFLAVFESVAARDHRDLRSPESALILLTAALAIAVEFTT